MVEYLFKATADIGYQTRGPQTARVLAEGSSNQSTVQLPRYLPIQAKLKETIPH